MILLLYNGESLLNLKSHRKKIVDTGIIWNNKKGIKHGKSLSKVNWKGTE